MADPPLIVCPIDFSDTSRTALQYSCAIADHFGARVVVTTVDDPLLATVAAASGEPLAAATKKELQHFIHTTVSERPEGPKSLELQVTVGKPAAEILRTARERRADLIVMSSQGRSGTSKRFFGSTTEAVLRATDVPVLVTPKTKHQVTSLSDIAKQIRHIVVPVDLSSASARQLGIAATIGRALSAGLIVPYIIEPVFVPPAVRWAAPGLDAERRAQAESSLHELVAGVDAHAPVETLVVTGDPSEEIVKLARTRDAGLIVMGLHSSDFGGPRMGSVTYRVLSMTTALVLALPPGSDSSSEKSAGQPHTR